jgi:hypothetical protein
MEEFARLAFEVKRAVERLEDEFCGLEDWPDIIGENMPKLAAAANAVANEAEEWARMCNDDFDPSTPRSSQPSQTSPNGGHGQR